MKFIDETTVEAKAGDGGPGSRHFRREKFVPEGGPDGGNGGNGGSVILKADTGKNTLLDLHFKPFLSATNGEKGGGSRSDGKSGEDLVVQVPVGTQVLSLDSHEVIADLSEINQTFILAKGGRGGKGNAFFKSATNRTPTHAQPGEKGEHGKWILSLKLVADVGLIGFPNAGKSTLISKISAARPKVADYPFTTLTPNLGVVKTKSNKDFVVADIPGLIPDAHLGKGLGIKFLKHVERTRLLVHLIDPIAITPEGEMVDPIKSFKDINFELSQFSNKLASKEQIIVITKGDAFSLEKDRDDLLNNFSKLGLTPIIISSITGEGIPLLIDTIATKLSSV